MGDRFTPPSGAAHTVVTSESETQLDHLVRRLGLLGAKPDELDALRDAWHEGDDSQWVMPRADLAHASDDTLLALLADVQHEYHVGTTSEDEDAARAAQEAAVLLAEEAWVVVSERTVPEVMEWVGTDTARAVAATQAEQTRPQPRATLLDRLGKVSGG